MLVLTTRALKDQQLESWGTPGRLSPLKLKEDRGWNQEMRSQIPILPLPGNVTLSGLLPSLCLNGIFCKRECYLCLPLKGAVKTVQQTTQGLDLKLYSNDGITVAIPVRRESQRFRW